MPWHLDEHTLAQLLPGAWIVGASSLPAWLAGEREDPSIEFTVLRSSPFTVMEHQRFTTPEGKRRDLVSTARWAGENFVSRGRGLRKVVATRWEVSGVSDNGAILVIRIVGGRASDLGLLVLSKRHADFSELRSEVASSTEELGLSPEDFARLSWFVRD